MDIPIERPLHIVSIPENSLTRTVSIDTNILDLYLSSGYNADDFSITHHLDGVDVDVVDTNALDINLEDKTISGTIALRQRLDFENPSDGGENPGDNDYEVATFRVVSATSSNDFKLIVRITDAADPKKLEILIDSYHLEDLNQQRGIREVYLYENNGAMDPLMGNDLNNFLTVDLVEDTSFLGDVDASTDLAKLYDRNDGVDAFLTATTINNNSNTYHRISLEFTEEVYIEKVAIRGRQLGGYYGFVFIIRDKNDHIIYVHQASNPLSRGSGFDASATSTYAFVPDYENRRFPITNFDIELDNTFFDIIENSTEVILVDNFSVAPGYEYERGIVSIDPGVDIDKFNVGNLYFLDNELVGLSFKTAPDAEDEQDADSNNVYEVGMVTITNIDGGQTNFDLAVRVVNVPSTVSLYSNAVSYRVTVYTSNIIDDLTALVHPSNFNNIDLGSGTFIYELIGTNASYYFKTVGNSLKTANDLGFRSIYENNGMYTFQVRYRPEGGVEFAELEVTVQVVTSIMTQLTSSAPWGGRDRFQALLLTNDDLLVMGGVVNGGRWNDIWMSQDNGASWEDITPDHQQYFTEVTFGVPNVVPTYWDDRHSFAAVVLKNNDILLGGGIGGRVNTIIEENRDTTTYDRSDTWISKDGGRSWGNFSITSSINGQQQLVLLKNGDILAVTDTGRHQLSTNGGTNWHWISHSPRKWGQTLLLINGDVLSLGGIRDNNDVQLSTDGGRSWTVIADPVPWRSRFGFKAVVLNNNNIIVMGGRYDTSDGSYIVGNDIWISGDGGTNWTDVTPTGHWSHRQGFQTVVLRNDDLLLMGGHNYYPIDRVSYHKKDIWRMRITTPYNLNY